MSTSRRFFPARSIVGFLAAAAMASVSYAAPFFFSTGDPDGLIATASRPGPTSGANQETETGDDFILSNPTQLDSATFTGLLPAGVDATADISEIVVEIYQVFPLDSNVGRTSGAPTFSTPQVPTRVNSPSDVELVDRSSADANLTFTTVDLGSFTVANSIDLGIHSIPGESTGGDGPVTGDEVVFSVTFTDPIDLLAGHYFFVPQVLLSNPDDHFLWLSAPKPITGGTGAFAPDLQTWIRNATLDPDWLRVGTDITNQGPFNAAFSLTGTAPEPDSLALVGAGLIAVGLVAVWRHRRKRGK